MIKYSTIQLNSTNDIYLPSSLSPWLHPVALLQAHPILISICWKNVVPGIHALSVIHHYRFLYLEHSTSSCSGLSYHISLSLYTENLPLSFIHSFRIFLQRLFKSTTTQRRSRLQRWHCVGVNTPMRYRQLWVKNLPKVPTRHLERGSNLWPSERKAPNLPLNHHALSVDVQL